MGNILGYFVCVCVLQMLHQNIGQVGKIYPLFYISIGDRYSQVDTIFPLITFYC